MKYVAEIPTHHESEHHSESAAIAALHEAERAADGVRGQVVAVEDSGDYESRTVVYPTPGPTRST